MELRYRFLCLKINVFNHPVKELREKRKKKKNQLSPWDQLQLQAIQTSENPGNSQMLGSVQPKFSHPDRSPPKKGTER